MSGSGVNETLDRNDEENSVQKIMSVTAFREVEKHYKHSRVNPKGKTREFLSVDQGINMFSSYGLIVPGITVDSRVRNVGTNVYEFPSQEGLYLVRCALDDSKQLSLAHRAVSEFSTYPYTNLTNLEGESEENSKLWKRCCEAKDFTAFKNLRWVNIGVRYNWTERQYQPLVPNKTLPSDLAADLARIADSVGYPNYCCETAIINYYHSDSTMGAHVDDAEDNMSQPIVSVSLGCAAVFLIGGTTRDTPPTQILLRSGDVLVMGGASRYNYHGIARVFRDYECEEAMNLHAGDDPDLQYAINYLRTSRINVNVRQVTHIPNNEL